MQELRMHLHGLYTNPNTFSEAPEGALLTADNVVLDRESILSTRRGQVQYQPNSPVSMTAAVRSIFTYNNTIIVNASDGTLYYDSADDGSVWTQYSGTYDVPDNTVVGSRIRAQEQNKNFYFTTSQGVFKLDDIAATPITSGSPPALDGTGATSGTPGFMADSTNVAYRVVWGYTDLNNNLILGAPSSRIIVSNTSGFSANVSLTVLIPPGITTAFFYQVYRTSQTANTSIVPNDEMQQVYEANPDGTDLSNGYVTVLDTTSDDLRQGALYTSPSQQGISNANYPPPFCKDMAAYKNILFFANTRSQFNLSFTLVGTGAPNGIQNGDTVQFNDLQGLTNFTITGAGAENAALGQFKVFNTGNPANDIDNTARSIIRVINTYASNVFLSAYYQSGFQDLPGQMFFQKRNFDPLGFTVFASRSTCWNVPLPPSGTNAYNVARNDINPNRVYFSKVSQPESVPLLNFFDVGSANKPIQRILALRDNIIILKDDGIWQIWGQDVSSFRVSLLDASMIICAPNSAVVLNNQVYFFSTQGIVTTSANGTAIVSRPIETQLLQYNSPQYPDFADATFAISYESDRKYILFTVTSTSDTYGTQAFVYNYITNAWTRWVRNATCGLIDAGDNKMYQGGPLITVPSTIGSFVYQERKTLSLADFADEQYDVVVTAYDGQFTVTLTDASFVQEGMTFAQSTFQALVVSVDQLTGEVVLDAVEAWVNGAAIVYSPISVVVQTNQIAGNNPAVLKQIQECSFIFERTDFDTMEALFLGDFSATLFDVTISPQHFGGWGTFPWGQAPWGGAITGQQRIRTLVPQDVQRVNWLILTLTTSQAFTTFALEGVSFMFEWMSSRQRG